MKIRERTASPEVFYGKLSMVPALSLLLGEAPQIRRVEMLGERQFYDRVYRVTLILDGQKVVEEVVRNYDESFLWFVQQVANVKTREELLALDERGQIYYD